MTDDAAVEALAEVLHADDCGCHDGTDPAYEHVASVVLDALPALLRADGLAGVALRARLGLQLDVFVGDRTRRTELHSTTWEMRS